MLSLQLKIAEQKEEQQTQRWREKHLVEEDRKMFLASLPLSIWTHSVFQNSKSEKPHPISLHFKDPQ